MINAMIKSSEISTFINIMLLPVPAFTLTNNLGTESGLALAVINFESVKIMK